MSSDEKSQEGRSPKQGSNSFTDSDKDSIKLSKRERKVYELLLTGKHSVTDITIALGYGDPRSYVRCLREKGIKVQSVWVNKLDTRYKLYFVEKPKPPCDIEGMKTAGEVIEQTNFKNLFERRFNDE